MGENSKIEWTDHTFNPWMGCTKVSEGCANCYAEELMDRRYGKVRWGKGQARERTSAANWRLPVRWNRDGEVCVECGAPVTNDGTAIDCRCGRAGAIGDTRRPRVFCASLADWLDDEVPIQWLADLLMLIFETPNLDWLLLTKRPENWEGRLKLVLEVAGDEQAAGYPDTKENAFWWFIEHWLNEEHPPENVWLGTSVENQPTADKRIPELVRIPAKVRFLSCEPLLGAVDFGFRAFADWEGSTCGPGIQWVICGGESGTKARAMHPEWVRGLKNQCLASGVAFFFKQWGEWVPTMEIPEDKCVPGKYPLLRHDGALFHSDEGVTFCCNNCKVDEVKRVGKKAAGRVFEGKEWNEFPGTVVQP